ILYGTERGKIGRVIYAVAAVRYQRAAQHESVVVRPACTNRCDYRRVLKFGDPDWAEPFRIQSEGRQEASCCDREVGVRIVVELQILKGSKELTLVRTGSSTFPRNEPAQVSSRFNEPLVP